MRTIVVTNERGGIGKTMLTCHIAWHLAEQGKRVVVLDLDKQCPVSYTHLTLPTNREV